MQEQRKWAGSVPVGNLSSFRLAARSIGKTVLDWPGRHKGIVIAMTAVLLLVFAWSGPFSFFSQRANFPLELRPDLAGNFGEIRTDHLHTGLDIRTGGKENLPVYSVAAGFISRIEVSEHGYGKVLFVQHPNGTTTVYAHLNHFNRELDELVAYTQTITQQFELELRPKCTKFPVKKGQLIGYTGNTGDSQGPHLHYEIRSTSSGIRLNPLRNKIGPRDVRAPQLEAAYWYDRTRSIYTTTAQQLPNSGEVIVSSPVIGLGITAMDRFSGNKFRMGVYQTAVYLDDSLIYQFKLDSLSESDSRYANALIDYPHWINSGKRIQFLFTLPGNHIQSLQHSQQKGLIRLTDTKTHVLKLRLTDYAGNSSSQSWNIRRTPNSSNRQPPTPQPYWLHSNRAGEISRADFMLLYNRNSFYDEAPFWAATAPGKNSNSASNQLLLSKNRVPVHEGYTIKLRTTLPRSDKRRPSVVLLLKTGKTRTAIPGNWESDFYKAVLPAFGDMELVIDQEAPKLNKAMLTEKDAQGNAILVLDCSDNLGSIAYFSAQLNEKWIRYEKKGMQYRVILQGVGLNNSQTIRIRLRDLAGNEREEKIRLKDLL